MRTLILGASVINEGKIQIQDVLIQDERIERIGDLSHLEADQRIEAEGRYLMPGMIDDQVHFREPGLTHKGDIETESTAAVAGGITSYLEMPNVKPITDNVAALHDKYDRAAQKSLANFGFYLGATNSNLEVIESIPPGLACGLKIFMGASTGNMLVNDPHVLESIFARSPLLIVTHCEDTPMISENEAKFRAQFGENIPVSKHPEIRSREACLKSSTLAVELAKKHGSRLHVLHLTTADELALFTPGPIENKKITAEVCVHHLWFSEEDYARLGNQIKCNPAIKTAADRAALLKAVQDDRIDIIATDHAPHTWEEKQKPYFEAPSGLPLVQHALLSLFDLYHRGIFSLEKIIDKVAHAPAKRFKIAERGFIREGYYADLVLVDLHANTPVTQESLHYKCGWSPFLNHVFSARVDSTWVNGHRVYHDGQLSKAIKGKKLIFNP